MASGESDAALRAGLKDIFSEFGHVVPEVKASTPKTRPPKSKKRQRPKPDKQRRQEAPSDPTAREEAVKVPAARTAAVPTVDDDGEPLHGSEAAALRRRALAASALAMAGKGKRMTFGDDSDEEEEAEPAPAVPARVAAPVPRHDGRSEAAAEEADAQAEAAEAEAGSYRATGRLGIGSDGEPWHAVLAAMEKEEGVPATGGKALGGLESEAAFAKVQEQADAALRAEAARYQAKRERTRGQGGAEWLRRVLDSGTFGDKVAALSLMVTEAPVQSLDRLDHLVAMARRPGRRDTARQVTEALRDVFTSALLPPDRRLVPFHARPLRRARRLPALLALWRFEDALKARYAAYVAALQAASADAQVWFRRSAAHQALELLSERPEAEAALLGLVVNKLGDPDRKLAAGAGMLVQRLLRKHPAMQPVVVREVRQFLARPGLAERARHQAVLALGQMVLSRRAPETALALVASYVDVIASCLNRDDGKADDKAGPPKSSARLVTAALTGVNRAFPFARPLLFDGGEGDAGPAGAAGAASSSSSSSSAAAAAGAKEADDAGAKAPGRETPASLRASLFARVDELFRLVHRGSVGTAVQALGLLFRIMEARHTLSDRFYRALYSKLADPAVLVATGKHAMLLNLVFKAVVADADVPRRRALLKRLCQVALAGDAPLAAAVIFLVSKVHAAAPELAKAVSEPGAAAAADGPAEYDAAKREPRFAGAETTCLWELAPLAAHHHPSVRRMAAEVVASPSSPVTYSGDPLSDLTLMAFLDRFSYRNPKKLAQVAAEGEAGLDRRQLAYATASGRDMSRVLAAAKGRLHGESLMQRRSARTGRAAVDAPASSSAFRSLPESAVREDDAFMHRYFRLAAKAKRDVAAGGADKEEAKQKRAAELAAQMVEEEGEEAEFARALAESLMREADEDDEDDVGDFDYDEEDAARAHAIKDASGVEGESGAEDDDDDEDGDDDDDASDDDDDDDDAESEATDDDEPVRDATAGLSTEERARLQELLAREAASMTELYHEKEGKARRAKRQRDEPDGEDDSEETGEGLGGETGSGSESDEDEAALFAAMAADEEGGSESEEEAPSGGRGRQGKQGKGPASSFASLEDFEAQMDAADAEHAPDTALPRPGDDEAPVRRGKPRAGGRRRQGGKRARRGP